MSYQGVESGHGAKGKSLYGALCQRLYGSERLRPLQRQGGRRALVVGYLSTLAAFPIVGWMIGEWWSALILLLPYTGGAVLLSVATHGVFDRPVRALDERQAQIRTATVREPYVTGASLGLAAGMIAAASAFSLSDEGLMMGTMLGVIGLLYSLPPMRLAWTMRDEVEDGA